MACKLEGKVALVTGSAEGLGKVIAEALLSQGAKVCVCDVNAKLGEETVRSFEKEYGQDQVFFSKCDVTKYDELEVIKIIVPYESYYREGLQPINQLTSLYPVAKYLVQEIGSIRGTQLAVEAMRTDKGGKGGVIVNTSSIAGVMPSHNLPVYTATKHAIIGFTRSCADNPHYIQAGLSFACICPGSARTTIYVKDENGPRVKFPFNFDKPDHLHEIFGVMAPSKVGEAFLRLLGESSPNGAIVTVSEKKGYLYKISRCC